MPTPQSALTAAVSGDTILVARGTYQPTTGTSRAATFALKNGVTLQGGYPNGGGTRDPAANETILSGEIGAVGSTSDNSYHVVTGSGTDASAVLDGFTITGGYAPLSSGSYRGGGMYIDNGSPTLRNLTFKDNLAYDGGGMFVAGNGAKPTLTDVAFINNTATHFGGGITVPYPDDAEPTLRRVTLSGNQARNRGGGAYTSGGTWTDVTFSRNKSTEQSGGGMACGGDPTLTNVTFSNNTANVHGGGLYTDVNDVYDSATLTNVTFFGNSASFNGGGMYNMANTPTLTNVTFAGNTAAREGGAFWNNWQHMQMRNVIVWGNTPARTGGGYTDIYYSVKEGGLTGDEFGDHIITEDPRLGTLGNYGGFTETIPLLPGSSAIDTANAAYAPDTDQRGVARPQGAGYDIGAYESSNEPPVADAGPDQTVEQTAAAGTEVQLDGSGSSDPDGDDLTYEWDVDGDGEYDDATGPTPTVALNLGEHAIGLKVTDASGESDTDTVTITIVDTTDPELTVPADVTAEQANRGGTPVDIGVATALDVCDADVAIANDAPAVFPLGETVVTWTATDDSGNVATATQNVTVVDTTKPELTLPADVTAEQTNRDGTPADIGQATAVDICDADVAIANDAPAVFPLGETTVTWTATDDAGNVATATQKVTVVDTTKPELTLPADVTAEQTSRDGTPADLGQATATDICDADVAITNNAPAVFPLGETTVTWTATDDAGNVATATQTVTVVDTTPPALDIPDTVTAEQTNRDGTAVAIGQATATDICDADPAITDNAPAVFPLGTTTVTWTATDDAGNTSTDHQVVVVVDTTPPVLAGVPADIGGVEQTSAAGAVVTWAAPTATDVCDAAPGVKCSPASGSTFPLGATTVTVTASDASGNSSTATFEVKVVDTTAPSITAPASITVNEGDPVNLGAPPVSDICDAGPDVTNDAPAEFADGPAVVMVTWTAQDHSGNSGTATQTVTVNNVAPAVGAINAPVDPSPVGAGVQASAGFTDPGTKDTHTATWNWGDDSTSAASVNEVNGAGTAGGSHTYSAPGIYTLTLTVRDKDGAPAESTFRYVVVYDPEGGFVTGGGWILSPAGAYAPNPTLTGKANFGFSAKYKKGATVPDGQTQFSFSVGNLSFHGTSYEWLVVAGAKAQFKGSGSINGGGNYGFLLTAIDGQISGGGGTDKFRIKIWDKGTGTVVYDNQRVSSDDSSDATALGGGSIVIHN
ncbi:MAG: HYR domain-containing protein [Armatimonadetes bacterium]|nr:HYR domain-containing protein [Armatimonadota bacterium]